MKKLIVAVLLLLSSEAVYALPVGNPAEASLLSWGVFFPGSSACCNPCDPCCYWFDAWSLRVGYYGDFVFNRNLEIRGGFGQGEVIRKTQIATNAGYLALNIADKLDIFGTLGASTITITTGDASWIVIGDGEGRLDWKTYFSWSAGARGTLFEWRNFLVGVEGQYFQTRPKLNDYTSFFDGRYTYFSEDNKMTYREWQVGIGLSYAIDCYCSKMAWVPYAAAKWSWSRFDTNEFRFIRTDALPGEVFTIFNLKNHKFWGYAVGITTTFCDMIGMTLEGRWGDEKAIYFNSNFRF